MSCKELLSTLLLYILVYVQYIYNQKYIVSVNMALYTYTLNNTTMCAYVHIYII